MKRKHSSSTLYLLIIVVAVGIPVISIAATLTVGPGQAFTTVSSAVAAASPNDVVNVQSGVYINDFPVINVPLTINGVGGIAILQATENIPNQKGILLVNATATVTNLQFQGAVVTDSDGGNGAGIRYQGGNLTIDGCAFINNQDGILANPVDGAVILIDHSTFTGNGSGTGSTHAIYINSVASFTVQNSTFNGTKVGHDVKSRAVVTAVLNNYLDDGLTGTTSYAIDVPNGGNATITGNQIVQGPNTQNPAMIEYGAEGETYSSNSLLVSNNIFINSFTGNSVGLFNHTSDVQAQLVGNTFTDVTTPLVGPGTITAGPTPVLGPIFSSVLPGARSVQVGGEATIFATIANGGNAALSNCAVALPPSAPAGLSMSYQATNPQTNIVTGAANNPVSIAANGSQSFVLGFRSSTAITDISQSLQFQCSGLAAAPVFAGVNTVDLIFSPTPVADVVALLATVSGDGILTVPFSQGGTAAFAVASVNVGVSANLTVKVDTGNISLPISATLCQTNPANAQCLVSPASSAAINFGTGATPTFSIFVKAASPVAFAPSMSRIFVRFVDQSGLSHGSTSLAVRTD